MSRLLRSGKMQLVTSKSTIESITLPDRDSQPNFVILSHGFSPDYGTMGLKEMEDDYLFRNQNDNI